MMAIANINCQRSFPASMPCSTQELLSDHPIPDPYYPHSSAVSSAFSDHGDCARCRRSRRFERAVRPTVVESQAQYRNAKAMHPTILVMFLETSRTAVAMCAAGIAVFVFGVWAAKNDIAQARGLD